MLLAPLLPDGVHAAEIVCETVEGDLHPEERRVLGEVTEKRRQDFAGGRACARNALAALGVAPGPILVGPDRAPLWPPGVVGSITHCEGYRAAAVTRPSLFASIGIDAEPHQALPPELLGFVASPGERTHLASLGAAAVHWDRILFSAKESFYKAWFPLTGRWLEFSDLAILFDADARRFHVELQLESADAEQSLARFEGRFRVDGGYALTFYGIARGIGHSHGRG